MFCVHSLGWDSNYSTNQLCCDNQFKITVTGSTAFQIKLLLTVAKPVPALFEVQMPTGKVILKFNEGIRWPTYPHFTLCSNKP